MYTKLITLLVVATLILTGCGGVTGQIAQEETIEIGAIYMLTGVGSKWGLNSQHGTELAVQEINAAGGINGKQLSVIYEDNQGDNPKVAVSAYQKLKMQGVDVMLGTTWTPSGLALAPMACDDGTVMISPTLGVAGFNEACDNIFNLWPHDAQLSEALGQYLYDEGHREIAILGSLQLWEKEQAEAVQRGFETAGGTVVVLELPQGYDRNIRTELLRITESNPDAVVFTNQGITELTAIKLRELGMDMPFYSVLVDQEQIIAANGALEGTVVISSFTPSEEFAAKYEEAFGEPVDIGADTSYDAVMLLAEAMEATDSEDPAVIAAYLNGLKTYDGESGDLTFDGQGGVQKPPTFSVVRGTSLVPLE